MGHEAPAEVDAGIQGKDPESLSLFIFSLSQEEGLLCGTSWETSRPVAGRKFM